MRAIAQRYGAALADVALAEGKAGHVRSELAGFVTMVRESAELRNFLYSPAVTAASKQGVVEKLAAKLEMSQTVRNFLFVLIANRRTQILEHIQEAFETEIRARLGQAEAQITSARDLSDGEKAGLAKALERLTGKKIEAKYNRDPDLLAGAVVRIGSTIYDGSVRGQLERLRNRLAT